MRTLIKKIRSRLHSPRQIAYAIAVLLIVGASVATFVSEPAVAAPEIVPAPPAITHDKLAEPHYIGAGTCAARACHGSPTLTPGREWNSAYAVWIASDPHSQSYAVLFTPESRHMAAILGIGDPWKAERCIACHSAPLTGSHANAAASDVETIMADGVSCEVCHGPAEKYLAAHTMRGWEQLGDARYEPKFGMKNTADIAARAQVCVGCHVGQPDADGNPWRDVNHDLIAAGHPRLNFDYAAYIATLPPHWNTQKNPQKFEELHSWLIGQFAASEQALKVLQARATAAQSQSDKQTPALQATNHSIVNPAWPEFAEFDCFACHHGLSGASWRQSVSQSAANPQDDRPPRKPGTPAWGTWYFTGPRLVAGTAALASKAQVTEIRDRLNDLTSAMQTPLPSAARIAQDAAAAEKELATARDSVLAATAKQAGTADSAALRRKIIQSLAAQFHQHKPESWDEFVQYYLALVALHKSEIDAGASNAAASNATALKSQSQQLDRLLEAIRNRLSFNGDLQINTAEATSGGISKLSPILRVLRSGFDRPFQFDPYAKQPPATGETAGKNLFDLFDATFAILTGSAAAS